jgi:UDP-GlcNAc:undecaprenyl-phosphate GlcNAc-1-phosphate transferase
MKIVALKYGILDNPTERKLHKQPVPYLVGLSIALALGIITIAQNRVWNFEGLHLDAKYRMPIAVCIFVLLIGLIDDVWPMHYRIKFSLQILAVAVTSVSISLSEFRFLRADSYLTNIAVTMFWLVFVMNACNFFDNMDGLLSGTTVIVCLTYTFQALEFDQKVVASISCTLAFAIVGFIPFNFPRAKIYLGDAGSLLIGYLVGLIVVQLDYVEVSFNTSMVIGVLPLFVPLMDSLLVVIFRLARRVHPASPGKDHFSHRLLQLGASKKKATLECWALTLTCCVGALFSNQIPLVPFVCGVIVFSRMLFVYLKTSIKRDKQSLVS